MVLVEAFAAGLPVIASNLGSLGALVTHGITGLHFAPGNADELAGQVRWALDHPTELAQMRDHARSEFVAKYTAQRNYEMLMAIYQSVLRATT
jgi:glycosyltransferase involved in cell wall biosynthesis